MKARSTVALSLAGTAVLLAVACSDSEYVFDPPGWEWDAIRGDGNVVEQSREVGGIRSIDLQGSGELFIRQGATEELRIRAEENLLQYLRTEVHAGDLVIGTDAVSLMNTYPIEYHLTVLDLERVALTGAGQVRGTDLETDTLELLRTGVGDIEWDGLDASEVAVESSGVGNVTLSGSVTEQSVHLTGLGDYDGRQLTSAAAEVRIAGGGSATVRVRDRLVVTIHGSGNVFYIGDPVVVSSIHGPGGLVQIGV